MLFESIFEKKFCSPKRAENFWLECGSLFKCDYFRTYKKLIEKEKTGENIAGFSNKSISLRHQYVLKNMPPDEWGFGQSKVRENDFPHNISQTGLVRIYESHTGNTILTWRNSGEETIISLLLGECSSFATTYQERKIAELFTYGYRRYL